MVIDIADRAAAGATPQIRDAMLAAFARSAQYEYLFWDGAYTGAAGPRSADGAGPATDLHRGVLSWSVVIRFPLLGFGTGTRV